MKSTSRLDLLRWSAVVAPVAIVGVLMVASRLGGPQRAKAETGTALPSSTATAESKEAIAIEKWVADRAEPVVSPFESTVVETQAEVVAPRGVEGIRLTGVFSSRDGAMAAINGKLVREGQEISPGVTLKSIDARARKVILTLGDGRDVELTPASSKKK